MERSSEEGRQSDEHVADALIVDLLQPPAADLFLGGVVVAGVVPPERAMAPVAAAGELRGGRGEQRRARGNRRGGAQHEEGTGMVDEGDLGGAERADGAHGLPMALGGGGAE